MLLEYEIHQIIKPFWVSEHDILTTNKQILMRKNTYHNEFTSALPRLWINSLYKYLDEIKPNCHGKIPVEERKTWTVSALRGSKHFLSTICDSYSRSSDTVVKVTLAIYAACVSVACKLVHCQLQPTGLFFTSHCCVVHSRFLISTEGYSDVLPKLLWGGGAVWGYRRLLPSVTHSLIGYQCITARFWILFPDSPLKICDYYGPEQQKDSKWFF